MASTELEEGPPAETITGKVLYIEDDPTSMAMVEAMLTRFPNVTLLQAGSGVEGVKVARDERPDLILLDMHLPDTGGLEVVRMLSADFDFYKPRINILTGDRLTMDILKAMSLGAFECWVKPLQMDVLEKGLRRALTGHKADPAHAYPYR